MNANLKEAVDSYGEEIIFHTVSTSQDFSEIAKKLGVEEDSIIKLFFLKRELQDGSGSEEVCTILPSSKMLDDHKFRAVFGDGWEEDIERKDLSPILLTFPIKSFLIHLSFLSKEKVYVNGGEEGLWMEMTFDTLISLLFKVCQTIQGMDLIQ